VYSTAQSTRWAHVTVPRVLLLHVGAGLVDSSQIKRMMITSLVEQRKDTHGYDRDDVHTIQPDRLQTPCSICSKASKATDEAQVDSMNMEQQTVLSVSSSRRVGASRHESGIAREVQDDLRRIIKGLHITKYMGRCSVPPSRTGLQVCSTACRGFPSSFPHRSGFPSDNMQSVRVLSRGTADSLIFFSHVAWLETWRR